MNRLGLGNISKKSILMYAGAFTALGIAFMLVTGIMGSGLIFGKATVFIRSISTVKYLEETKAAGYDVSAIEDDAIPIDDEIIKRFPRHDEFMKGLESQAERIYGCIDIVGGPITGATMGCEYSYEFNVSKFEADTIRGILRELLIQHNKPNYEKSEAVKAYDPEKNTMIDGVIDSAVMTVKYKDVYYHIGVSESYIRP